MSETRLDSIDFLMNASCGRRERERGVLDIALPTSLLADCVSCSTQALQYP